MLRDFSVIFNKKASITFLDETQEDSVAWHLSCRPTLRVQHILLKFFLPVEMSLLSAQEMLSLEQVALQQAVRQTVFIYCSFLIQGYVCVCCFHMKSPSKRKYVLD